LYDVISSPERCGLAGWLAGWLGGFYWKLPSKRQANSACLQRTRIRVPWTTKESHRESLD
jgi:hypothetical protein